VSHIVTTVGFRIDGSFLIARSRCHVALHPVNNPVSNRIEMNLCHWLLELSIKVLIFINSLLANLIPSLLIDILHKIKEIILRLRIV